jgi:hypothetical protein
MPVLEILLQSENSTTIAGSNIFLISTLVSILLIVNKMQINGLAYLQKVEVRFDLKQGLVDKFIKFLPYNFIRERLGFEFIILTILDLTQIFILDFSKSKQLVIIMRLQNDFSQLKENSYEELTLNRKFPFTYLYTICLFIFITLFLYIFLNERLRSMVDLATVMIGLVVLFCTFLLVYYETICITESDFILTQKFIFITKKTIIIQKENISLTLIQENSEKRVKSLHTSFNCLVFVAKDQFIPILVYSDTTDVIKDYIRV